MRPPLDPAHMGKLSAGWRYSSGSAHFSFDIAVPTGTPIYAVADGVIADCYWTVPPNSNGYGVSGSPSNWILLKIKFGDYYVSCYYQHLSECHVRPGQQVRQGQVIGKTGNTGNSSGPHLHFTTQWADKGGYNSGSRYYYMNGISSSEGPPSKVYRGLKTASNNICIWPPDQLWTGANASTAGGDDVPEYRYLSKAKAETIAKGAVACIDWDAKSWGDGGGTSLTWEGNSRAMCHVVIGLSGRPDWVRVARYQKQSDGTFKCINGMGPAVDLPDMGNAAYSFETHGNVGANDLLRVEVKAPADKSITVSAGSGIFSAFYWKV